MIPGTQIMPLYLTYKLALTVLFVKQDLKLVGLVFIKSTVNLVDRDLIGQFPIHEADST